MRGFEAPPLSREGIWVGAGGRRGPQASMAAIAELEREVSGLEAEYAARQEALQREAKETVRRPGGQIAAAKAAEGAHAVHVSAGALQLAKEF